MVLYSLFACVAPFMTLNCVDLTDLSSIVTVSKSQQVNFDSFANRLYNPLNDDDDIT